MQFIRFPITELSFPENRFPVLSPGDYFPEEYCFSEEDSECFEISNFYIFQSLELFTWKANDMQCVNG